MGRALWWPCRRPPPSPPPRSQPPGRATAPPTRAAQRQSASAAQRMVGCLRAQGSGQTAHSKGQERRERQRLGGNCRGKLQGVLLCRCWGRVILWRAPTDSGFGSWRRSPACKAPRQRCRRRSGAHGAGGGGRQPRRAGRLAATQMPIVACKRDSRLRHKVQLLQRRQAGPRPTLCSGCSSLSVRLGDNDDQRGMPSACMRLVLSWGRVVLCCALPPAATAPQLRPTRFAVGQVITFTSSRAGAFPHALLPAPGFTAQAAAAGRGTAHGALRCLQAACIPIAVYVLEASDPAHFMFSNCTAGTLCRTANFVADLPRVDMLGLKC